MQTKPDSPLLKTFTASYEVPYSAYFHSYHLLRRQVPFHRFIHVPLMVADSRVGMGLMAIRGVVTSLSRFYVDEGGDADDVNNPSEIKKFVLRQIRRFWRNAATSLLGALEYGFYGAEPIYRFSEQSLFEYDELKSLHPRDIRPVTLHGKRVGILLKRPGATDDAGEQYLGGEKSFWHVHWRERDRWFGQSRLFGSFQPWMEMYAHGGGIDVRRLYYHMRVFQNDVIRYPEMSYPDASDPNKVVPAKFIAQEIGEKQRAGAAIALPSTRDANGELLWDLVTREHQSASADVRDYLSDLKREILEGMGIPEEVVQAASSGSGYSGRRVPDQIFRGLLQEVVTWMIHDFDDQVIRPLIRFNFNQEPDYEIVTFGLVSREDGDQQLAEKDRSISAATSPNPDEEKAQLNMGVIQTSERTIPQSAIQLAQLDVAV